jgi:cytochrome c553
MVIAMLRFAGLLMLTAISASASAQDIADKLELCMSCHGDKGIPSAQGVPLIAGRPAEDLAHQLQLFRDGGRNNPQMVMAKRLTDQEIEKLASYFATQSRVRP